MSNFQQALTFLFFRMRSIMDCMFRYSWWTYHLSDFLLYSRLLWPLGVLSHKASNEKVFNITSVSVAYTITSEIDVFPEYRPLYDYVPYNIVWINFNHVFWLNGNFDDSSFSCHTNWLCYLSLADKEEE